MQRLVLLLVCWSPHPRTTCRPVTEAEAAPQVGQGRAEVSGSGSSGDTAVYSGAGDTVEQETVAQMTPNRGHWGGPVSRSYT